MCVIHFVISTDPTTTNNIQQYGASLYINHLSYINHLGYLFCTVIWRMLPSFQWIPLLALPTYGFDWMICGINGKLDYTSTGSLEIWAFWWWYEIRMQMNTPDSILWTGLAHLPRDTRDIKERVLLTWRTLMTCCFILVSWQYISEVI